MSYRYELIVCKKVIDPEFGEVGRKIKRFMGNDVNYLQEKFELWFIKQGLDRNEIFTTIGEIQHRGY